MSYTEDARKAFTEKYNEDMRKSQEKQQRIANRINTIDSASVAALMAKGALKLELEYPRAPNLIEEFENLRGNRHYRRITGKVVLLDDIGDEELTLHVADCMAWLVPTNAPNVFRRGMDEISQGLLDMAKKIFDNNGKLRPELQHPPIGEGTTVWKDGFGRHKVLLVDEVKVTLACQRHGIGKLLVHALLDKVVENNQETFYAVAFPTLFWTHTVRAQLENASKEEIIAANISSIDRNCAFFRSLDFRRIGASRYLAWSPEAGHPSRFLNASDDYNPQLD